jgi:hypothetical protein
MFQNALDRCPSCGSYSSKLSRNRCMMHPAALLLFSLAQRKIRQELLAKGLSVETQKKNKKTQKPILAALGESYVTRYSEVFIG